MPNDLSGCPGWRYPRDKGPTIQGVDGCDSAYPNANQVELVHCAPFGSGSAAIRAHQAAFQAIADRHGGVRASVCHSRGPSAPSGTGVTFTDVGITFGGLITGFSTTKTVQEAALFGGTAGALFDACVWLPCDTFTNVNTTVPDQMSDAAAHVVLLLSRRNFARSN